MARVTADSGTASVAFVLLIAGFATKAGIVPLHVWLPRAHPEAPSHVSAVMSAAMVKLGVYGALLVSIRLLPGGPAWWGLLLFALGAVSAVYGILQASVATDLKRLLAYSTTENVGLMFLALGVGLLLRSFGVVEPADSAIAACLLLVVSHAAFKTTLFLGAGSILHATGERDLDRLGGLGTPHAGDVRSVRDRRPRRGRAARHLGLRRRVGAAAVADPRRPATQDRLVAVVMPVAVASVALTAGLALLTFVKAYGIAFLARPRGEGAAAAHESGLGDAASAMAIGASRWSSSGWPRVRWPPLPPLPAASPGSARSAWWGIDLPASMPCSTLWRSRSSRAALAVPVILVSAQLARRQPRRRVDLTWGCGGVRLSPRMQYTATSYAEPLSRVFDDALRPERDVDVTHAGESRYLVERVQFRQRVATSSRRGLPARHPVVDRVGVLARHLQNGSIHRYLGYSFVALLAVLVVVSL